MAISKQCPVCSATNPLKVEKCRKCSTPLQSDKFKVRVKKTVNGKDKWSTKVVHGISKAILLEQELLKGVELPPIRSKQRIIVQQQPSVETSPVVHQILSFPVAQPQDQSLKLSWSAYYASARLMKKSHRNDYEHWHKHIKHTDYQTKQGILKTLADLKDRGYAPATIKHVLTFIRRFHNWHIENELHPTGVNPCKFIKLPKFDNTVNNPLPLDEVAKVLKFLKTHDNRQMSIVVSFALLTGRRQGEILKLLKEDVDLSRRVFRCRNTKNGKSLSFPMNEMSAELMNEAMELGMKRKSPTVN